MPPRPSFESGEDNLKPKEELAKLKGEIGGGRPLLAWLGEDDDTASDAPSLQLRRPTPQPPHLEINIPPIIPPKIPEPGEEEPGGGRSGPGLDDKLRKTWERIKEKTRELRGSAVDRLRRLREREKTYVNLPPIDPKDRKRIRQRMQKIRTEFLDIPLQRKRKTDAKENYSWALEDIREAMIDRAIVANWAEQQLYDNYEELMTLFLLKFYDDPELLGWLGEKIREGVNIGQIRGIDWFTEIFKRERPGTNSYVKKGAVREKGRIWDTKQEVSPDDKQQIINGMEGPDGVHEELRQEWFVTSKKWRHWFVRIKVSKERQLKDEVIPFYQEYYINKGIVENWSKAKILKQYKSKLTPFYERCLVADRTPYYPGKDIFTGTRDLDPN